MGVIGLLLVIFFITSCGTEGEYGGVIEDSQRHRSLQYKVWVPTAETPKEKFPLVLLSHGSGGDYTNYRWLIDSLTDNGFMVAAVNHAGNTTRNNTNEGVVSVWHRPADLSLLLDRILMDERWLNIVDRDRIGAAGFSSGGYSVLAMVGARYDRKLMDEYCRSEARGKDCELVNDFSNVDYTSSSMSYTDERIEAVFAMAPAVGPAITKESLQSISSPVFITASEDDELVNPKLGAGYYAENIPSSELFLLQKGGHFIFLECSPITRVVDWFIDELDLCGTEFDVDRKEIRAEIAAKAVDFFRRELGEVAL